MKKYLFGAVLAFAVVVSPAFTQAASLTDAQVQAILSLLSSFGADSATINNVNSALTGSGGGGGGDSQPWCHTFNTNLTIGSIGAEVSALNQAYSFTNLTLNDNVDNSVFNENTAADTVLFQAKYSIRQTGYVGPITRAKLNSLYECQNPPNPSPQSLDVTSPNGGETWTKGTSQKITWSDWMVISRICPTGDSCPGLTHDIKLVPYYTPCTSNICPAYPYHSPYIIDSGVGGSAYNWSVGQTNQASEGNHPIAPDGSYTIQVCQSGTSTCDSSDSYFKIVSGTTQVPVISGVSGPTSLSVGQQGTWTVNATDPNNGTLNYNVVWGDEVYPYDVGTNASIAYPIRQTATFTHTYNQAGNYAPRFTVTNSSGQSAQTSVSVNVGGGTSQSSLSVTRGSNDPASSNIIAGASQVLVGSFKFSAQNSSYRVGTLTVLARGYTAASFVTSITLQYKDANGITKTATAPFSVSEGYGGSARFTGLTMYVPQNDSVSLSVYANIATIQSDWTSGVGINIALDAGSNAGCSVSNFCATDDVGTTIFQVNSGNVVTSGGTFYVRKSIPTLSSVPLNSTTLASGSNMTIGKVKITANAAGDVSWDKIVFSANKSANVSLSAYDLYQGSNVIAGNFSISNNSLVFLPSNEQTIAAGSSVTYDLRATVNIGPSSSASYLDVSIENPSTTATTGTASTVGATNTPAPSFVWSDRSSIAQVHSTATPDWSNDYLIKFLPLSIGSLYSSEVTAQPPITVTYPTAGVTLVQGQPATISWNGDNTGSYVIGVGGKGDIGTFPANQVCNAKCFVSWTPSYSAQNVTIGIYNTITGASGSSGSFAIVAPQTVCQDGYVLSDRGCVLAPPNSTLTASPSTITAGQPVTISYGVSNSLYCVASGGWTGTYYAPEGYYAGWAGDKGPFYPTQTTTYSFTCYSSNGSFQTQNATVTVTAPQTTGQSAVSMTSPNGGEVLQSGQTHRISWGSTGALDKVSLMLLDSQGIGSWIANLAPNSGYYDWVVSNGGTTNNNQYKVSIIGYPAGSNGNPTDNSDNFFTITSAPTQTSPVTLTASPTSITAGQSSTLTLSSQNMSYCSVSGIDWSSGKTFGTATVSPTQTTTYTAYCSGSSRGSSATASATVTVASAPPPSNTWTKCADEGGTCRFNGTGTVRYGDHVNEKWISKTGVNGIIDCNNYVFGDPDFGTVKQCEYNTSGNVLGASSVTMPSYSYTWNRDLEYNSPYTEDVKALQTALTVEDVYRGDITGGFYNQTFTAVQAFQAKYGIESTGFVGPITRAKLNTLY